MSSVQFSVSYSFPRVGADLNASSLLSRRSSSTVDRLPLPDYRYGPIVFTVDRKRNARTTEHPAGRSWTKIICAGLGVGGKNHTSRASSRRPRSRANISHARLLPSELPAPRRLRDGSPNRRAAHTIVSRRTIDCPTQRSPPCYLRAAVAAVGGVAAGGGFKRNNAAGAVPSNQAEAVVQSNLAEAVDDPGADHFRADHFEEGPEGKGSKKGAYCGRAWSPDRIERASSRRLSSSRRLDPFRIDRAADFDHSSD